MLKIVSLAAAASLLAFTSPKNDDYIKTSSGLLYKIVTHGSGPQVKIGEVLKINYVQKINDSVLANSYKSMAVYAEVDSVGPLYQPNEIFSLLHKGDSVEVLQFADSILAKMPGSGGSILKNGDKLYLNFKVEDVLEGADAIKADREKEMKAIGDKQILEIESKLKSQGINAVKTGDGIFVVIKNPGTGIAINAGKKVSAKYTGKLFDTEKVFETNMDKEPFTFTVGQKQVIEGWDQGLRLLKKGGKATLYIPGFLAYGPQPGPGGKSFENLIFDVEIVDVKDPAAPKPAIKKAAPAKSAQKPKTTTATTAKPKTAVKK